MKNFKFALLIAVLFSILSCSKDDDIVLSNENSLTLNWDSGTIFNETTTCVDSPTHPGSNISSNSNIIFGPYIVDIVIQTPVTDFGVVTLSGDLNSESFAYVIIDGWKYVAPPGTEVSVSTIDGNIVRNIDEIKFIAADGSTLAVEATITCNK